MKVGQLCEYTERHCITHCEKQNTTVYELYINKSYFKKSIHSVRKKPLYVKNLYTVL